MITPAERRTRYEYERYTRARAIRRTLVRGAVVFLALIGLASPFVIVPLSVRAPFAAGVVTACDVVLWVALLKAHRTWRRG